MFAEYEGSGGDEDSENAFRDAWHAFSTAL